MIYSMTAFSRLEKSADWGQVQIEIRSVNQRFLDLQFKLPEIFRHLEPQLRQLLQNKLSRGKVECSLKFINTQQSSYLTSINKPLAESLSKNIDELKGLFNSDGQINWLNLLQWPEMIQQQPEDMTETESAILTLFAEAIDNLMINRAREGQSLAEIIQGRLSSMELQVQKVHQQLPAILQWQRERILQKFEDAQVKLDTEKLEQEMVMVAQKSDVAEEMDRLQTHIVEFTRILNEGGAIGRRLDFLLQELNREANTLGSKSINTETTNASVELKVLIEQIREQIQNIE
ncbi:MAG: YicC family protein [Gammaproteobacteria bacterium CG22_combo_CG10-13_8_21_14_all_40_8]|nr:MAG: YicC family protein [Gammaproteobacteria bacterium CG22_combo_CG10-13_8_21_14_all_40_8]